MLGRRAVWGRRSELGSEIYLPKENAKRFPEGPTRVQVEMERRPSRSPSPCLPVDFIPCLLPPPAPFKVFVILAGGAGITTGRFTIAMIIGRGARYLALALLAVRYGDVALTYMHDHGVGVSLAAVSLLLAGLLAYLWWGRARARA